MYFFLQPALPEIWETLASLGMKVIEKSICLESKTAECNERRPSSTPPETQQIGDITGVVSCDLSKSLEKEVGGTEESEADTERISCGNEEETCQGITVGKVFQLAGNCPARSCEEKWHAQSERINLKAVQVKIPKLNTNELSMKEGAFTCRHPGCKLGFALKDSLRLHIKNLHPAEKKPYICKLQGCKSTFKSRKGLTSHVKIVHPGEKLGKPYPCLEPDCAVRFRGNRGLQDHLRAAHGAKKLTCDSDHCKTTFNYSRSLYVHKKKHHCNQ